jgi:Xaa-Pro dipeptidase
MNTRLDLIQRVVNENSLGALVFWRPDELVMSLGCLPHWGLSFAVFPGTGLPLLYIPDNEPPVFMKYKAQVRTYPLTISDPWGALFDRINQDLKSLGVLERKCGYLPQSPNSAPTMVAAESPALPENLFSLLASLGAGFSSAAEEDIKALYHIKLKEEIESLEITHRVAEKGVDAFYRTVNPGLTETEVQCTVESEINRFSGTGNIRYARGWAQVQGGENSCPAGKYNLSGGRILREGDPVMLELAVCVNGYWADLSRTAFIGAIPASVQDRYDILANAQAAAIASLHDGIPAAQVYLRAAEILDAGGYLDLFPHALGHGVGFRYHDFTPPLVSTNQDRLSANMVVTIEPGIYDSMGGMRVEDNILITEDGYRILSHARKGLKGEQV